FTQVSTGLCTGTDLVRPMPDQAALRSEFTPLVDRGNAMARSKLYELLAAAIEECVAADDKRAGMQLNEGGKCGFKIVVAADLQDRKLQPLRARCFQQLSDHKLSTRIIRVDEESDHRGLGHHFGKKLQPLGI